MRGCDDFLFAVDVNNPDIVVATEVYKDYPAHEDHFKTAQWGHFSGIMEKYQPRSIDVKTYDASETKYSLDDWRLSFFSSAKAKLAASTLAEEQL